MVYRRVKEWIFFFLLLKQHSSLIFQVLLRGHWWLWLLLSKIVPLNFTTFMILCEIEQMFSKCAKSIKLRSGHLDCFKELLLKRILNCLFRKKRVLGIFFNDNIFLRIFFLFLSGLLVFRIERSSTKTCHARTFVEDVGIKSECMTVQLAFWLFLMLKWIQNMSERFSDAKKQVLFKKRYFFWSKSNKHFKCWQSFYSVICFDERIFSLALHDIVIFKHFK